LTGRAKKTGTGEESTRQRIATALVYERLGLDREWRDPDFKIILPTKLPPNKGPKLCSRDAHEVEAGLRKLVAMGCRERALYWCVAQLGNDAEDARQGKRLVMKLDEDENKSQAVKVSPAMATQQDMKGLMNKTRAASKVIRKYRSELLLVADACRDSIDLPRGLMTEPELPEESMGILLQSLSWIQKLASAWQSPNPIALMKSKGVLFLMIYVWLNTTGAPGGRGQKKHRTLGKRPVSYQLPKKTAQFLAELIYLYGGADFEAAYLNDKVEDLAVNEPAIFDALVALLKTVDQTARTTSSTPKPTSKVSLAPVYQE
jgi:hypothetical protein